MAKLINAFFALVFLMIVLISVWGYKHYEKTVSEIPFPQGQEIISIPEGTTLNQAIYQLIDSNKLSRTWPYKLYFKIHPQLASIQAGDYLVTRNMTVLDALKAMNKGAVVIHQFTLVEGQTFQDLINNLNNAEFIKHTLEDKTPEEIAALIGIEGNPEGWFLPQTYNFSKSTTDLDILKRLHQAMKETLEEIWENRDPTIAIKTPYEALIMASIIEKETGIADERKQISGVFDRRLKKGMRLQTDPTVMYGMNQSRKPLKLSDLRNDTPYNTYTRSGLPPTPIAIPGKASLIAAVHPDNGDALFFVADGEGGHRFTPTYKDHLKAVREYRKAQK